MRAGPRSSSRNAVRWREKYGIPTFLPRILEYASPTAVALKYPFSSVFAIAQANRTSLYLLPGFVLLTALR
jgi:hypothetical protein